MNKINLLQIENWKLEAKLDDVERYFYKTDVVGDLVVGNRAYVIGRKGTGKTAIAQYLETLRSWDTFCIKLTFKNFPFNLLYNESDDAYAPPNQYITIWKFLILVSVLRLVKDDQAVSEDVRTSIAKLFPDDLESNLSAYVKRWTSGGFDLSILKVGVKLEAGQKVVKNETSFADRVDYLERYLEKVLSDNKYFVIFDELDEDYREMLSAKQNKKYTQLLTSLFKAVQDIRARYSRIKKKIYPIVFLRDDIYDVLQDPDRTKWSDLRLDINWNESSLKRLLAFRLSRAADPRAEGWSFDKAWTTAFALGGIGVGSQQRKPISIYSYISRSTLLRPRDFVRYLSLAAKRAREDQYHLIGPMQVKEVEQSFSSYLRSEFEDEIHGVIPNIKQLFDIFNILRKSTLSIEEFRKLYAEASPKFGVDSQDPDFVLKILFHFSVIGNQSKQKTFKVFRYNYPEAQLNFNESIVIHRGLYRAFQIL